MRTRYCNISGTEFQLKSFDFPVDEWIEEIEVALGMFPDPLRIDIILYATSAAVDDAWQLSYHGHFHAPAWTRENMIHISIAEASRRIVVHELTHAIINLFFDQQVPGETHELLAQAMEERIK